MTLCWYEGFVSKLVMNPMVFKMFRDENHSAILRRNNEVGKETAFSDVEIHNVIRNIIFTIIHLHGNQLKFRKTPIKLA